MNATQIEALLTAAGAIAGPQTSQTVAAHLRRISMDAAKAAHRLDPGYYPRTLLPWLLAGGVLLWLARR